MRKMIKFALLVVLCLSFVSAEFFEIQENTQTKQMWTKDEIRKICGLNSNYENPEIIANNESIYNLTEKSETYEQKIIMLNTKVVELTKEIALLKIKINELESELNQSNENLESQKTIFEEKINQTNAEIKKNSITGFFTKFIK